MTDPAPPTSDAAPRSRRRWWIAIAIAVVLVVALRAALPFALAWGVGWAALNTVGLDARVRNIDLGLFQGMLLVEGLWVAAPGVADPEDPAPDPKAALAALERFHFDIAWTELARGGVHVTQVTLDQPRVRVARQADGRIDPLVGATPPPPDPDELQVEPEPEPEIAEPTADAGSEEAGGGWPISLDSLDLLNLEVRVIDDTDGQQLAAFDLAELDLKAVRFADGAFGLGGIALRRPVIQAKREFLLDPSGGKGAPQEEAEPEPAAADAPPASRDYRVDDLEIERAAFTLQVGEKEFPVGIRLKADGVTMDAGSTFPLSLGLDVEGGELGIDGTAGLAPPFFDGKVVWKDMPIPLLALGLRPDLGEWLSTSTAGGDLAVRARLASKDPKESPGLQLSGRLDISGVGLDHPSGDDLQVAWKRLDVVLEEVDVPLGVEEGAPREPIRVHVGKVALIEPDITFKQPTDAIERLVSGPKVESEAGTEQPEAAPEPEGPAAPAPQIRVDHVHIADGKLHFVDRGVTPPYDTHVRKLVVDVRGLTLPGPTMQALDVDIDFRGNANIKVSGRAGASDGRLDLDVHRIALPPVNGYASKAGLKIAQGTISFESDVRANGKNWDLDNTLTLHDLQVDREGSSGFAENLPMSLDLALAVLRQPNGDIALPVPMSFEEGEAELDLAGIISGALSQALVGAATIPLKAVGAFLGGVGDAAGGGLSVQPLLAIPGSPRGTEGALERASALVDLLVQSPSLRVVLIGTTGEADRGPLAEQILGEQLEAGGDWPEIEDHAGLLARGRIKGALRKRAEGKPAALSPEDAEYLRRYAAATPVSTERLDALARERATRTRRYLLERQNLAPERVVVSDQRREGEPGVLFEFEAIGS